MSSEAYRDARRQIEICNACRYCEGYCSVFPAIARRRVFADGDITQIANLCHDCRGCYYACQYTEPHEFALNLPRALAEIRRESWKAHAWPRGFARLFDRGGGAIVMVLVVAFALVFGLAKSMQPSSGAGFYAYMSHGLMVTIFVPAFLAPIIAMIMSIRQYWLTIGGGPVTSSDIRDALRSAGRMKNLSGGHGDGCNFEEEDRYSNTRRWYHQAAMYGFLLCFASTASGTVLHYGFGQVAPHGPLSLPKLFGVPGGILLCWGSAGLAWLKLRADRQLGASRFWHGEFAFVMLLFSVSATGLLLYAATGTAIVEGLLAIHLGTVLAFFLLTPYSKMVHGFYRLAALTHDAARIRHPSDRDPGAAAQL